jgi:hypothetical protein
MQSSNYYAVSAQGNGFEGVKSYTIDVPHKALAVMCAHLLADVKDNKAIVLSLQIGSVLNLKTITWEKLTGTDQYAALGTTNITGKRFGLSALQIVHPKKALIITGLNLQQQMVPASTLTWQAPYFYKATSSPCSPIR